MGRLGAVHHIDRAGSQNLADAVANQQGGVLVDADAEQAGIATTATSWRNAESRSGDAIYDELAALADQPA